MFSSRHHSWILNKLLSGLNGLSFELKEDFTFRSLSATSIARFFFTAPQIQANIKIENLDSCEHWLLKHSLLVSCYCFICKWTYPKTPEDDGFGQKHLSPHPNELLISSFLPASFKISIPTSQPPLIGPLLPRYSTCSRDWAISKPVRIRCQWYQGISSNVYLMLYFILFSKCLVSTHTL